MTLFDRVSQLSKKQGKSLKDVAEDLDLSRHAFYSWKTSSPKAESLEKVADYFGVSTDYLLGREDKPNSGKVTETELDKALENAMTWNGEPLTDKDKEAVRIFLEGRKSK